jgi:hypothetical protein
MIFPGEFPWLYTLAGELPKNKKERSQMKRKSLYPRMVSVCIILGFFIPWNVSLVSTVTASPAGKIEVQAQDMEVKEQDMETEMEIKEQEMELIQEPWANFEQNDSPSTSDNYPFDSQPQDESVLYESVIDESILDESVMDDTPWEEENGVDENLELDENLESLMDEEFPDEEVLDEEALDEIEGLDYQLEESLDTPSLPAD